MWFVKLNEHANFYNVLSGQKKFSLLDYFAFWYVREVLDLVLVCEWAVMNRIFAIFEIEYFWYAQSCERKMPI